MMRRSNIFFAIIVVSGVIQTANPHNLMWFRICNAVLLVIAMIGLIATSTQMEQIRQKVKAYKEKRNGNNTQGDG